MEQQKSGFSGKIGFVLAAAGSAVGLGNLWRFPYLAAKYGGGIFLLTYIILAVTFGFALMTAEIAIGRKTGKSALGAFGALNKKFNFCGVIAVIVPAIILPYYSVIGGWVSKYFATYVTGNGAAAANPGFFGNFVSQTWEPIIWFLLYIAVSVLIVMFGVQKGVEKVSKILMPVLVVLSLGIAIYVCFIPGMLDGVLYYIKPDFSNFSIKTVLAAMGQLFYSMSLAMGIMITYGSYMKKNVSIESSVHQIEIFDTGIAFLAGLMIVPIAFGGGEGKLNKGPSLMFETLPEVFSHIPGGQILGAVFFLLVLLAALTSSISLAETIVAPIQEKFGLSRVKSCLIVLAGCIVIGLPSTLGFGAWSFIKPLGMDILSFFDFVSNSIIMPVLALITSIFVGWVIKPKALEDEIEVNGRFPSRKLFRIMIKYVCPVCILLILISSVLDVFGVFHFDIAMIFQHFHRPDHFIHHLQFQQIAGLQIFGGNFFFLIQEHGFFTIVKGFILAHQSFFCRIHLQSG